MQQLFKRNPTAQCSLKTHRWGENAQGGKIRVLGLKQRQSYIAKVEKTTAWSQFLTQLRPGRDNSLDMVRYGHTNTHRPQALSLTPNGNLNPRKILPAAFPSTPAPGSGRSKASDSVCHRDSGGRDRAQERLK